MSPIRVVLIEDDELTRVSLRTALKKHQQVEWLGEAENARNGLNLLRQTNPDVALVDLGLPDISGLELIKTLKSNQNIRTKMLVLTLRDDENSVLRAFSAGADAYCMKDIAIDLLLEAIKATYQGNAWIDAAIAHIILKQATLTQKTQSDQKKVESHPLTEREIQVLQLIVNGYSNALIAEKLFITIGTVKTHVRNILNKLSADDRTQAAVHALRSGIVI